MGGYKDSYSLRCVADLPPPFCSVFTFRYFNSLQSECFPVCFLSDINMVVSAPTGTGKTVLFELCILRLLSRFLTKEGKFNHSEGVLKTVYIAPSKELVQEKLHDWNMKLSSLGIICLEMTGDSENFNNTEDIRDADIILTTPEKFDAMTLHGARDGLNFFSDIALVLIDEVHLLNDPGGSALEAIVSRIKMLSRSKEMNNFPLATVRFLAVSATIPNIEDLAEWLLVPSAGIKSFGEEMRPVKLTTKVFGYTPAKNDFLFEKRLLTFIFDNLMQHSKGKSALIFCSTRKGAQEAAQHLSQIAASLGYSNPFIKSKQQQEKLKEASLTCSNKLLQSCIIYGVGYHNGGLSMKDRNIIESLFLKGEVQILCTTNTLAHGINLPAHSVVIKSTQYYNKEKGMYLEFERSMVLQMCGRAGRPPFDDTGTVIIMTRRETVHLYENLLNGCEMVESRLLPCAMEHLNAEIIQLTVSDICLAIEWLKCSYLYVRIKKNPENYGIKRGIPCEVLEKRMREICVKKISELAEYGMIWTDEDGFILKPLEPGRLMTKFYMKFDTMKEIVKAPEGCSLEDALHIVCRSEEISWIQLRCNEKKLLSDINVDKDGRLRFHVLGEKGKRKKRIQTREEKIFVLVNDCLTGDPSAHDLSFKQDMNSICMNGCRISKCMKEYFIYNKSYKGALSSTLLAKSLHQRLWDDSPYLLKQLPGIGMVTAKALNSAGINSFESMEEADPRKIEMRTGRKFPFGNHIKGSLSSLPPKLIIKIEELECRKFGNSKVMITVTRLSKSGNSNKQHYADILVGSEEDDKIIFHQKLRAGEFTSPYSATVSVSCPQYGKVTVKADLIFEEYIGLDVHEKLVITWEDKLVMTRVHESKMAASDYSVPKENFLIKDDQNTSYPAIPAKFPKLRNAEKRAHDSMPTFELLEEETEEDPFPSDHVEKDVRITGELDKPMNDGTILDHIRKKSKTFPTLMTSRSMNISHKPMILTKMIDSVNLFQADKPTEDSIIMIDSEPMEASDSMLIDITESPIPVKEDEPRQVNKSIGCYDEYHDVGKDRVTTLAEYTLKRETFDAHQNSECSKPSQFRNHLDVSYLGFRSVFSFL